MTRELKPILLPEFVWLAEVESEPVGFSLCVPDINVALQKVNGRLTTFGLPDRAGETALSQGRLKSVRLVALGVLPKFRRHGIAEMLVLRSIEEAMIKRGCCGEASLILENNLMMNRFLGRSASKNTRPIGSTGVNWTGEGHSSQRAGCFRRRSPGYYRRDGGGSLAEAAGKPGSRLPRPAQRHRGDLARRRGARAEEFAGEPGRGTGAGHRRTPAMAAAACRRGCGTLEYRN